jgi:hypothetical protein
VCEGVWGCHWQASSVSRASVPWWRLKLGIMGAQRWKENICNAGSLLGSSQQGPEEITRGAQVLTIRYVLETAVAAQDVAPGLTDQRAVHRQHAQPHLQQNILQPAS